MNRGLNTSQLQNIANTGTFGIVTDSGNYQLQSTSTGLQAIPILNTLSGDVSKFLQSTKTNQSNPQGSTGGTSTQTIPSPGTTNSDSLTTAFNTGLQQVEGTLKNHPEVLLGLAVIGGLILFGAIRK